MTSYIVSTDTGGTFVDAVIWNSETGGALIGKDSTTPGDPAAGILGAVRAAAELGGLSFEAVVKDMALFLNGTTVSTNAMIERKGVRTGLLITAGFEDTLSIANVIGRTAGLDEVALLDYRHADAPPPIVPINLVRGVTERIDARGDVLVPLDMNSVRKGLDELIEQGIEALAICLLWSFRNPSHERQIRDLVAKRYPQLYSVASSDLVPVIREYERANSTAINAYLGPIFEGYAAGLRARLKKLGHAREPLIMQSVGGLASAEQVQRVPISTLFSGPVGGVVGGLKLGKLIGEPNVITTDMGGTTFDVGLILDGSPLLAPTTVIERQIVCIPTVELVSIGAGGGSIARVNEVGVLQVGPKSMGSTPGPACYCRGGKTPTVTDADVVLGYIDPEYFLGGHMHIDRELALQAIQDKVAAPLGLDPTSAAAAIYEIVNAQMADLIRRVTVERGNDPRDFAMLAFGGCGPTHCTGYGPDIGVRRLVVPAAATAFSAYGISQSDLRHSLVQTVSRELRDSSGKVPPGMADRLNAMFSELLARAHTQLRGDGVEPGAAVILLGADMRYQNQIHEITVRISSQLPLGERQLEEMIGEYGQVYEKRYGEGSSSPTARIELVNVRVDAIAPTLMSGAARPEAAVEARHDAGLVGEKLVYRLKSRSFELTPVYAWEQLDTGQSIEGPALIVSYGTTIPLHDKQSLTVDAYRNIIIEFPRG